jgi:hypothetical protein
MTPSVLPELLFLTPFAPLLIRIALASIMVVAARRHWLSTPTPVPRRRLLAAAECALGAAIFLGFLTQAAALGALALCGLWLIAHSLRPFPKSTIVLAMVTSLTLVITGAGLLSFDLPL